MNFETITVTNPVTRLYVIQLTVDETFLAADETAYVDEEDIVHQVQLKAFATEALAEAYITTETLTGHTAEVMDFEVALPVITGHIQRSVVEYIDGDGYVFNVYDFIKQKDFGNQNFVK